MKNYIIILMLTVFLSGCGAPALVQLDKGAPPVEVQVYSTLVIAKGGKPFYTVNPEEGQTVVLKVLGWSPYATGRRTVMVETPKGTGYLNLDRMGSTGKAIWK